MTGLRLARSWWAGGLGGHLAVLLAVLVALVPFLEIDRAFTPDEGQYALQVQALDGGDWALEPPSAAIDPALDFPPWRGPLDDGGIIPYAQHPAYPLLLEGLADVAGDLDVALLVTGLGGVLATAAAAWCLAQELRPGAERVAFWLVAASPVVAHGYVLWAHAPSVAATTWAAVFLVWAIRRRSPAAWIGCGASLAAAVLVRSEALLVAAGFIAAAGLAALVWRRRDVLLGAGGVAVAVAVVVLLERAVVGGIRSASPARFVARGSGSPLSNPSYLAGRIDGIKHTLLEGAHYSNPRGSAAQFGAILLVAGGMLLARRGRSWAASALAGLGGAVLFARVVVIPEDPIPGLLVAWPIALAGVAGAVSVVRRGDGATRVVVGGAALAFVAIVATQYSAAGVHWGGRFFLPLVPLLAVLAAVSWSATWPVERRVWLGWLVGVSLVLGASSLLSVRSTRLTYDELSQAVLEQHAPLAMTPIRSIPQALWNDDQIWMTVGLGQFDEALGLARSAGVDDVVVLWPDGLPYEFAGWEVVERGVAAESTFDVLVLRLSPR